LRQKYVVKKLLGFEYLFLNLALLLIVDEFKEEIKMDIEELK
jgi:hypothetical protein